MQLPVTSVTLALRLKRLADFSIFCFPEDVLPKEAIGEQYDTLVTLLQKNMPKKKVKL